MSEETREAPWALRAIQTLRNLCACAKASGVLLKARIHTWAWRQANVSTAPSASGTMDISRGVACIRLLTTLAAGGGPALASIAELIIPRNFKSLRRLLLAKGLDNTLRCAAYDLLHAICFLPFAKTPILSHDEILDCLLSPLRSESDEEISTTIRERASHGLWTCIYNNAKGRALLAKKMEDLESINRAFESRIQRDGAEERAKRCFEKIKTLCMPHEKRVG
ncbi:hypothetical protein AAMO2058_000462000 [Amorphochlora amoebiformis]